MKHFTLIILLSLAYLSLTGQEKNSSAKNFQFNELTFHSSPCNGTCPNISLNIRGDKKIQLVRVVYKEKEKEDIALSGSFKGSLKNKEFNTLIGLLKNSNLDSLQFPDVLCCDAPVKTLLVSYNGKFKRFKSMTPPKEAEKLITFLTYLATTVSLPRYNGPIDFEE